MITFVDYTKPEDLEPYKDWNLTADQSTLKKMVLNEQGQIVSPFYKGHAYTLIGKYERDRGIFERIFRAIWGILLAAITLGIADVAHLFSATEIVCVRALRPGNDPQRFLTWHISEIQSFAIGPCRDGCLHQFTASGPKTAITTLTGLAVKDMLALHPHVPLQFVDGISKSHFDNLEYLMV